MGEFAQLHAAGYAGTASRPGGSNHCVHGHLCTQCMKKCMKKCMNTRLLLRYVYTHTTLAPGVQNHSNTWLQ
jgi:hypothetical protein